MRPLALEFFHVNAYCSLLVAHYIYIIAYPLHQLHDVCWVQEEKLILIAGILYGFYINFTLTGAIPQLFDQVSELFSQCKFIIITRFRKIEVKNRGL